MSHRLSRYRVQRTAEKWKAPGTRLTTTHFKHTGGFCLVAMDTVYISIFNLILSSVTVILRNAQGGWHTKHRIKRLKKLTTVYCFVLGVLLTIKQSVVSVCNIIYSEWMRHLPTVLCNKT